MFVYTVEIDFCFLLSSFVIDNIIIAGQSNASNRLNVIQMRA